MQVLQIKHQCAHSNLFGYHDKKHKFGWTLMYPKFLFLSYHVYHIIVKIVSKMLSVTLYSLRSEITVGNFVLAYHKVCTKCPTVISDRREYHFLIIYSDMTLIFAKKKS
jgi:hypothetical protein